MLESRLISFKRLFPWLWRRVEAINGVLFLLGHRNMREVASEVLAETEFEGYEFSLASIDDAKRLSGFFQRQPEESFRYFIPHFFDEKTLRRLIGGHSFLVMKAADAATGEIKGYFFLRCFFIGRAFAGLLVDSGERSKGLGTSIWEACSRICGRLGIRMFATVSERNLPSMISCRRGTEIISSEKISDDYLLVECGTKSTKGKTDKQATL